EVPAAVELAKRYYELGAEGALPLASIPGKSRSEILGRATRIESLVSKPDNKELILTAVAIDDAVFAGFPGEPFTEVGIKVKQNSPFSLTIPACCANGYEGYYPMQSAFDEKGYEASTARYVAGTAEKLIEASSEIINSLKK
ncbi:MAG: hypothetical protein IJZ20_06335, partial [Clostridia bacterium]|nr:hypothetical protein [Clostridia bacterium]